MGTYLRNGIVRAGGIGCPKPPNNGTTGDVTVTTAKRISTTTTTTITATATATPSATGRGTDAMNTDAAAATVRFSTVETRYYPRAIGDNPTVTCGIPLTIEWDYIQDETTVTMIGEDTEDGYGDYGGDYCYDRLGGGDDETKDGMGGRSGGEDEKCSLPSQHRYRRRPHRHGDELVLTSMERAKILKGAGFTKEELVEALMERARIQQLHENDDNKDDDDDTDDEYSEKDRLAWVERQRRRQQQQQQQQQRSKQWQEQLWTWTAAIHKMKTTMKMDPFQNWMHGAWERLLRGCRHVDHDDDDDDHAVGDMVVLPSSSKTSSTIPVRSWDRCWPHNRDRSSNDCHRRAGNQPSRATVSTVVLT